MDIARLMKRQPPNLFLLLSRASPGIALLGTATLSEPIQGIKFNVVNSNMVLSTLSDLAEQLFYEPARKKSDVYSE